MIVWLWMRSVGSGRLKGWVSQQHVVDKVLSRIQVACRVEISPCHIWTTFKTALSPVITAHLDEQRILRSNVFNLGYLKQKTEWLELKEWAYFWDQLTCCVIFCLTFLINLIWTLAVRWTWCTSIIQELWSILNSTCRMPHRWILWLTSLWKCPFAKTASILFTIHTSQTIPLSIWYGQKLPWLLQQTRLVIVTLRDSSLCHWLLLHTC